MLAGLVLGQLVIRVIDVLSGLHNLRGGTNLQSEPVCGLSLLFLFVIPDLR